MQSLPTQGSLNQESMMCPNCSMVVTGSAKFCNECGHQLVKAPKNDNTEASAIFVKTKMCAFYLRGMCARGASCKFAHGRQDQMPLPDLYRTSLCSSILLSGICANGSACPYAHTKDELRRIRISPRKQHRLKGQPGPEEQSPHAGVAKKQGTGQQHRLLLSKALGQAPAGEGLGTIQASTIDDDVQKPASDTRGGADEFAECLYDAKKVQSMGDISFSTEALSCEDGWSRQISRTSMTTCDIEEERVYEELDFCDSGNTTCKPDLGCSDAFSDLEVIVTQEVIESRCAQLQRVSDLQDLEITVKNTFLSFQEHDCITTRGRATSRAHSA